MAEDETTGPDEEEEKVRCVRTGQEYDSSEHSLCPYCFGEKAKIKEGQHGVFCDYDPKRDPIHFGFPPDSQRAQGG